MTDDDALRIHVALGDRGRFEIFRRVAEAPGLYLSELRLGKSASTASHHIKMLVEAGALKCGKDGKHNRYHLNSDALERFAKWAAVQAEVAAFNQLTVHLSDNPS